MLRPLVLAAIGGAALLVPGTTLADQDHGKHLAKGHDKPKNVVVKGTVVSTNTGAGTVTVHVTKGNRRGRALVGQDATFTIPAGKVHAADRTGDKKVDLADVNPGDKVLVQARLPANAVSPYAGRKLVDQTSPPGDDADDD